jgi:hypothetical protein
MADAMKRIRVGMNEEDVLAVLADSGYSTKPGLAASFPLHGKVHGGYRKTWDGDRGRLIIFFNGDGKVARTNFRPTENFFERLRRRLFQ